MKLSLYTNFLKTVTYSVFQNRIVFYQKNQSRTLRASFLMALDKFCSFFKPSSYCKSSTFSSKKVQILKPKQIFFSNTLNKLNILVFCNRNKSNPVTDFVSRKIFIVYFLIFSSNLFAQEENQTVKEKMTCQKIELIINGQKYDDGHKCVSSEAICYLVEGLSLSCFAKPNTEQISDKPKTN
ncbi:hypothetical protein LEP1GSC082_4155 [Leptospira kirschneri str. H2]|uniref:Uncharacterized protein n=2 Tax=Leptospira kirschneri TaxID=29507 RepID=A0A0E2B756_9LEPT|nr:hypothetical protein [Leptospira kirschneri]EKO16696.1 hypothetical protein LEP1GSC081_2636 [Leptospira kirschneri str. H1]EKO59288.1 hypothetical protein LEP1GSC082_4155 [Leptospira kirschneri str. H2]EMK23545.1 hypothetical protein LEP1GSC008_1103 [Leptospira kirschneri serovar Bulgarica str. Nikolaevo]